MGQIAIGFGYGPTISESSGGGGGGDPYVNNVALLTGFDGTDAAVATSDESGTSNKGAATFVGNAHLDTAQKKFGTASLSLDGTGDKITFPDHADWDLSDANADKFTIDAWIRPHAAANSAIVGQGNFGANRLSWVLWFSAARQLSFYTSSAGNTITNTIGGTGTIMTLDTWYHVAADKDAAGKIRLYVNGSMVGSATPADSTFFNSTDVLEIGSNAAVGDFNGWIDELRITKSVARYASDSGFTIPIAAYPRPVAPTDPYFANVVLLVGANGADGSTSFVDESGTPKTLTAVGNAQIDTAQFKFGTASIMLDGADDYISIADHADWTLGTSNSSLWTMECWARFSNVAVGYATLIAQNVASTTDKAYEFNRTGTNIDFWYTADGSTWNTITCSGITLVANTWYHLAVDHDATGKVRVYVDGVMRGSQTAANSAINNIAQPLTIGARANASQDMAGWIDEVRITKGAARYASDSGFTVPTAAFPRS